MTWGFHIYDFMIEGLGLKGNELLAYALIYSCTCKGNGSWHGSYERLAEMIGTTRRTAINTLDILVNDELIEKKTIIVDNVPMNIFKAKLKQVEELIAFGERNAKGSEKNSLPLVKNLYSGSEKFSPNILNDTINDKEDNNIYRGVKKFTKPSIEEISSYCLERGNNIDANYFFDFYESKGWKVGKNPMKDWKATVRTWERNQKTTGSAKTTNKMDTYNTTLKDILEGRL